MSGSQGDESVLTYFTNFLKFASKKLFIRNMPAVNEFSIRGADCPAWETEMKKA